MATIDERELWEAARGGDRAALEELLRRHETQIYRFGLRMCGDPERAKEVLQRTLLAAFEQVAAFRGEARPSTWLYAVARSFCSREHRRTRSAPVHDVGLDTDEAPVLVAPSASPDDDAERRELEDLAAAALSALPEKARLAVVLHDVEGLTNEEAAGVLGVELNAFKSRLHRARQQLKVSLAALLRDGASKGERACPKLAARLGSLAGQAVDRSACAEIEQHLDECPACHASLGSLREAASMCRRIPGGDVPEPVKRAVRAALREAIG